MGTIKWNFNIQNRFSQMLYLREKLAKMQKWSQALIFLDMINKKCGFIPKELWDIIAIEKKITGHYLCL